MLPLFNKGHSSLTRRPLSALGYRRMECIPLIALPILYQFFLFSYELLSRSDIPYANRESPVAYV